MKYSMTTLLLAGLVGFGGCAGTQSQKATSGTTASGGELLTESGEPAYITVQHCLISFGGTGTPATRSKEEAEELALSLFEQVQNGADFDEIVKTHTDDSFPGIYNMANRGFSGAANQLEEVIDRDNMVPAFGDTGFPLAVGEYGLAVFDAQASRYGWHIVKRIK